MDAETCNYHGGYIPLKALPSTLFPTDEKGRIDVHRFENEYDMELEQLFRSGIDFNLDKGMGEN